MTPTTSSQVTPGGEPPKRSPSARERLMKRMAELIAEYGEDEKSAREAWEVEVWQDIDMAREFFSGVFTMAWSHWWGAGAKKKARQERLAAPRASRPVAPPAERPAVARPAGAVAVQRRARHRPTAVPGQAVAQMLLMDIHLINGKPVRVCTAAEVDAYRRRTGILNRWLELLTEGLAPEEIVGNRRDDKDAEFFWQKAQEVEAA